MPSRTDMAPSPQDRSPSGNTRMRIRLYFDGGGMFGPGKADLLTGIDATGSIAAAGREMGMSYKRAWTLVETMNAMFREPLVVSQRGGAKHGGAVLTEAGRRVLQTYRTLESNTRKATASEVTALETLLAEPAAQPAAPAKPPAVGAPSNGGDMSEKK